MPHKYLCTELNEPVENWHSHFPTPLPHPPAAVSFWHTPQDTFWFVIIYHHPASPSPSPSPQCRTPAKLECSLLALVRGSGPAVCSEQGQPQRAANPSGPSSPAVFSPSGRCTSSLFNPTLGPTRACVLSQGYGFSVSFTVLEAVPFFLRTTTTSLVIRNE